MGVTASEVENIITVADVVSYVDDIKPNAVPYDTKHEWVLDLERELRAKIVDEYETNALQEDILCATPLFKDVYRWYLEAMIDDAHAETQKYNNSATKYNAARAEFADYYNRTHKRKRGERRHFI